MGVIKLHGHVQTNKHSFESLAEKALDLLQKRPGYEYATFECDGVEVSARRGASMEEIRADFQSRRYESLTGRPRQARRR